MKLAHLSVVAWVALAGCLGPDTSECSNGSVCPPGLKCAFDGVDTFCTPASCGNRAIDGNDLCDDGNFIAGDGCSRDCLSPETCGTSVLDADEE